MCRDCHRPLGRRGFLSLAAGAAVAAVAAGMGTSARAAYGPTTSLGPDEALAKLREGNARYVANAEVCAADLLGRRSALIKGQAPWATIVSCADSRVPPELIFGGLGLGELFVARNAGNLVDTATLGTIEYGAAVLGSPLIVVLGHSKCGAVAAACEVVTENATFPGSIGPMIQPIIPAALAVRGREGDFVDLAVRENARRVAGRLPQQSAVLADVVAKQKVKIVAARYDLESGAVEFLI